PVRAEVLAEVALQGRLLILVDRPAGAIILRGGPLLEEIDEGGAPRPQVAHERRPLQQTRPDGDGRPQAQAKSLCRSAHRRPSHPRARCRYSFSRGSQSRAARRAAAKRTTVLRPGAAAKAPRPNLTFRRASRYNLMSPPERPSPAQRPHPR